jgi:regulator of ribonuclease activity A
MDGAQAMTDGNWATADLMDAHPDRLAVVQARFTNYGGVVRFHGPIATVRVDRDWRPVLAELEQPGDGRVLVVDGGGVLSHAVLGERLFNTAARNGWVGVLIHGAIRDTNHTRGVPIGLRALGVIPQRGESGAATSRGEALVFAEVTFVPGEWLWADDDGIVVGPKPEPA